MRDKFDGVIKLIARNEMPSIKCKCGKDAKWVCSECFYNNPEKAFLCDVCAKKHECGEDMLLPVVNSPRIGLCGYEGSPLVDTFKLFVYKRK